MSDLIVLDDQCPISGGRCNHPCGTICLRSRLITTVDRSAAPDYEFAALLERIEAAPDAEEAIQERVARVLYREQACRVAWDRLIDEDRDHYRRTADAALAALRTPAGEQ